jgi:hypothetical protein
MAIGPKELLEKVVRDEEPRLRRVEQRIDEALATGYDGRSSVAIDASLFEGIRKPALDKLITAYRQAGWTVEYQSDQREGDFYQFSSTAQERRDHGIYS